MINSKDIPARLCWYISILIVTFIVTFSPLIEELSSQEIISASLTRQLAYGISFILAVGASVLFRGKHALKYIPVPIFIFFLWSLSSVTWSLTPNIAIMRVTLIVMLSVVTIVSVRGLGSVSASNALTVALYIILICNFLSLFIVPSIGFNYHPSGIIDYQWEGLMGHKNSAGAVCAVTMIFIIFSEQIKTGALKLLLSIPPFAFLLGTISRTSIVALCIALISGYAMKRIEKYQKTTLYKITIVFVWIPSFIAFATILIASIAPDIFAPLFVDRTVGSNRGVIWWPLIQMLSQYPLIGHGYGSLWNSGHVMPDLHESSNWVLGVTQAHNGYLDISLQLGLVGLALALFSVFISPVRRLILSESVAASRACLPVGLIIFVMTSNLTESGLLSSDSFWSFILLVAIALSHSDSRRERKKSIKKLDISQRRLLTRKIKSN